MLCTSISNLIVFWGNHQQSRFTIYHSILIAKIRPYFASKHDLVFFSLITKPPTFQLFSSLHISDILIVLYASILFWATTHKPLTRCYSPHPHAHRISPQQGYAGGGPMASQQTHGMTGGPMSAGTRLQTLVSREFRVYHIFSFSFNYLQFFVLLVSTILLHLCSVLFWDDVWRLGFCFVFTFTQSYMIFLFLRLELAKKSDVPLFAWDFNIMICSEILGVCNPLVTRRRRHCRRLIWLFLEDPARPHSRTWCQICMIWSMSMFCSKKKISDHPVSLIASSGPRPAPTPRPGDWYCPNPACMNLNYGQGRHTWFWSLPLQTGFLTLFWFEAFLPLQTQLTHESERSSLHAAQKWECSWVLLQNHRSNQPQTSQ